MAPFDLRNAPSRHLGLRNQQQRGRSLRRDATEQSSSTSQSNEEYLRAFRAAVDRISDEVEAFAEQVDIWTTDFLRHKDHPEQRRKELHFKSTLRLLSSLNDIADKSAKNKSQESAGPRGFSDTLQFGSGGKGIPKLDDPQAFLECSDTWKLVERIYKFQFHFQGSMKQHIESIDARDATRLESFKAEASESGRIWDEFLASEPSARERCEILTWLENKSSIAEDKLEEKMKQLELHSGNAGSWSRGWMNSRESIKDIKRSIHLDGPLNESQPVVRASGGSIGLVSQLDPDAPSRELRQVADEDSRREMAHWGRCYQMLRTRTSQDTIEEFCKDREELWRAASLGVLSSVPEQRVCISGADCGALFRRMCYAAARNPKADLYERACYGLLGGYIPAVDAVAEDRDDYRYARVNAELIWQFDAFVRSKHPGLIPQSIDRFDAGAPDAHPETLASLDYKSGQRSPAQGVQDVLIENTFLKLATRLGFALRKREEQAVASLADIQLRTQTSDLPIDLDNPQWHFPVSDDALLDDENALRLVTHLVLIYDNFRWCSPTRLTSVSSSPDSGEPLSLLHRNIVLHYIKFLQRAGKFELIPTYAAHLGHNMGPRMIAPELLHITSTDEKRTIVNLLENNDLSMKHLLEGLFLWAMATSNLCNDDPAQDRFRVLVDGWDSKKFPDVLRARFGELPLTHQEGGIPEDEALILRAVEWALLVEGQWEASFVLLTMAMTAFLRTGKYYAAKALADIASFKAVSAQKTPYYFKSSFDVYEALNNGIPLGAEDILADSTGEQDSCLNIMFEQSRAYFDMEMLVQATQAMEAWENFVTSHSPSNGTLEGLSSDDKAVARDLMDDLQTSMEPVMREGFLVDFVSYEGKFDELKSQIEAVRRAYVPELTIAYVSCLCVATMAIGRDYISIAYEVARSISRKEAEPVAKLFVDTGRMADLVTSMALASRYLLKHNQESVGESKRAKASLKKKGWNEGTLHIWDIASLK